VFHSNHSPKQVGVQPPPSALDVTLPAFAGERRRLMHRAHISCPHGAQQQTRRPPPLLLSIDGTDRQTDVRPLQGPCSACYASSVSDITGAHGPCQYQLSFVAGNTTRRPLTPSVVLTLSALSADAERGLRIGTVSVRSSVCLVFPLQHRAVGLLLWAQPAGDIDTLLHGQRSAAKCEQCHVVSVRRKLSADLFECAVDCSCHFRESYYSLHY